MGFKPLFHHNSLPVNGRKVPLDSCNAIGSWLYRDVGVRMSASSKPYEDGKKGDFNGNAEVFTKSGAIPPSKLVSVHLFRFLWSAQMS